MRRASTRRFVWIGTMAVILLAASGASAAPPERQPFTPDPTVLEPGQACTFNVEIAQGPGSKFTETVFDDGRTVIIGSGSDRITNLDDEISITLPTSGKITFTELANGDLRAQVSGRTVFFFFEGDQGPSGLVGEDGALYHIVGHVDETLDPDTGFTVTSFEWSGRATELCSLISP